MYRKSYCTTPSIGTGVSKMLIFLCVSFFNVMGKVLTGELSCPEIGLI